MEKDTQEIAISPCCEAELFEVFMNHNNMHKFEVESGIKPMKDYTPFTEVALCANCYKVVKTPLFKIGGKLHGD